MKIYVWCAMVLAFALASCGGAVKQQETDNKTVFKYNEPAGVTSLDPAFARSLENIWAVNQLFNGLIQMNKNLEIMPCIAKSWEVSDDGLEYVFRLRDDVYFHDHEAFEGGKGRKVVAQDFVHSFFRIIDPEVASPGAYIFNYLDRSKKSNYIGFEAPDDTTFRIFLKRPFPPFLGILTMQYCSVVPHEIVEFYKEDFRRHPVGTGPFQFKMWKEGVKLILVKNENYFETDGDDRLPYLDAVSISFVKERNVALMDFIRGNIDFVSGLDALMSHKDEVLTQAGELQPKYRGKFRIEKQPFLNTVYLGILIDETQPIVMGSPLKMKAVRQAINYGFNREKMVKYLRNNIGMPAYSGFVPLGMPSFDKTRVTGYDYDPDKAMALLTEAGFIDKNTLPPITLTTTTSYQDLCEYIQHELNDIGITVQIEVIDEATFRQMVAQCKVNIFRKSWVADYPDAENYLALFYSKNFSPKGPNYTHFSQPAFDALYEKAMAEVNDSLRYDYYRQMDQMVMDEAPVVPLYYDEVMHLIQNNISGLETNPMNLLTLKRVKKTSAD